MRILTLAEMEAVAGGSGSSTSGFKKIMDSSDAGYSYVWKSKKNGGGNVSCSNKGSSGTGRRSPSQSPTMV